MQNRPRGRKVFTGGGGGNVFRPGSSSGGHSGGSYSGGHSGSSYSGGHSGGSYSGGGRGTGGRGGLLPIIIIAAVLLFGGGGLGASNLLGGGDDYQNSLYYGGSTYDGWYDGSSNTGSLNTDVSSQAREKFTAIKGGGRDISTVMVYMCGTDLESNSAMATKDLNEMLQASVGSNLNLIVYTGGCKSWRNNTISSDVNQIWQIQNGKLKCLERNAGNLCMTEPSTLSSFIRWTAKRYPANRMDLIFWDHGSGSISGYGYDQKYPRRGSMSLGGIDEALKNSGVKFDFVGFDACLMATSETALTVGKYADYMIGSEEVEPGIGWYYTNWLSQLSDNPSISTLETGRTIADDFVSKCASQCKGQPTTLSVVDLAELTQTLPETLNAFASDSSEMISGGKYKEVATARSGSKEFAGSSRLDQIDLTHFAMLMDTSAGNKLAKTLKSAVKYNRTSNNTANAYGLSIYFPLRTLNKVDSVTDTYSDIGMDEDYSACIRKFAQMEVSGQAVSGGNTISPFDILLGGSGGGSQQSIGTQAMQQLIGQLLSGNFSGFGRLGLDGLNSSNTEFLSSDPIDAAAAAEYVSENSITSSDLKWQENRDGQKVISLTEDQWSVVKTVDLQMFYDDGEGYIDLGLDNIYDFDEDGNLLPYTDKKWLSINGQVVAYYHTETIEKGDDRYVITGYVPIKLNGEDARLILSFDNNNEEGYIAGVSYDYDEDITETEAKNLPGLQSGDSVEFICSFYSYDGTLQDSYQLGNTYNVDDPDDVVIRNVDVGSRNVKTLYKFTDIYDQEYWTPEIK